MSDIAANVRRLMARDGLTVAELSRRTGLAQRTLKDVLAGGRRRPHARTLHRLASGLNVSVEDLLCENVSTQAGRFDRQTNPLVEELIAAEPHWFAGWTEDDFDELYSRFGTGGAQTIDGVRQAAQRMLLHRDVHERVAVVLESSLSDVLVGIVNSLHDKVVLSTPQRDTRARSSMDVDHGSSGSSS
ncbi:MAG: helix-turn-helix transcriptional regulator [Planctomycetales bacterium]|nr:helix-turn-helix transcriptional regulator [Planctomycetales bacterium]